MINQKQIRNFCIISHIDHGKSTLADRFLELTGTVEKRKMKEQFLDQMDLERRHGVTIKLQPARMVYKLSDDLKKFFNFQFCILNLIDTPGHIDFSYEVSRSLAACEGAILIVDATQGIEAQTLANVYLALEQKLTIIPVINKIDLSNAEPEKVASEVETILKIPKPEIINISAKKGINIKEVLKAIIEKIPPPHGNIESGLRALVFDSIYDQYKGAIAYIKITDGILRKGENLELVSNNIKTEALEIGYFKPHFSQSKELYTGEVGYIATGLKEVSQCQVGDTITEYKPCYKVKPLPGYKDVKSIISADIFPTDTNNFLLLKDSLEKLKLNDASLSFKPIKSLGLGAGFRGGFLGLFHLEIIKERLETEYGLKLTITMPSVSYKVTKTNGQEIIINNPSELPFFSEIKKLEEPWIKVEIISPRNYLGRIMELGQSKRGIYKETNYIDSDRIILIYEMPLSEVIGASGNKIFYDQLKSISSGYASLSYDFIEFRSAKLVKLDILIAGDKIDVLSQIVCKDEAYRTGRFLVKKLKKILPSQLFVVALQAAIGNKVIARETIPARRKDVTAKLYGGDFTRKSKLLEKQKKGKKKMKFLGKISITSEILFKLLKQT